MSTPNGYNNPAYCHQFDSSLYDYQYVPEIDPDSPDLNENSSRRQTTLTHPGYRREGTDSDDFGGSDESNGSIIIEECNNRRVTLICEKRSETADRTRGEYYGEENCNGTYYQDVSLESEDAYDIRRAGPRSENTAGIDQRRSLRHQRPLEPPVNTNNRNGSNVIREYPVVNNDRKIERQTEVDRSYQRHRYHRYEEIPTDEEEEEEELNEIVRPMTSVHRYAEISSDENGYPTLRKAIEIEKTGFQPPQRNVVRVIQKPRAVTPTNTPTSGTTPVGTPSRTYQRNPYAKAFDNSPAHLRPISPSQALYSHSPSRTDSYEMAELSPPRSLDPIQRPHNRQSSTVFVSSPKRQPPIGASPGPPDGSQDPFKCIIPMHLQKHASKVRKERSHSVPNSPRKTKDPSLMFSTPNKSHFDKKVMQIFHIKPVKSNPVKTKTVARGKSFTERETNSARRNISNSFTDSPRETPKRQLPETQAMVTRSPYKPTTTEINQQPKTAIITPIFQRKNPQIQDDDDDNRLSPTRRNFEKMSQAFQSTGNIFGGSQRTQHPGPVVERDQFRTTRDKSTTPTTRLKRNQSVPNFSHTFTKENGVVVRKTPDNFQANKQQIVQESFQYSPSKKKSPENLSPLAKSRLSLLDGFSSWSNSNVDYYPRCSTCFIFATIVHLVTATATCAITFYLLSKVGRKYYLDFGLLAGFVNFILGLLGFRSYCWRWIPNRNYVSGFIGLAAFSAFTCAGLSYLIIVKPMAGDPILDILGGAICAVSVLTILLALTGLTMSGCCKAPPPDNRVNDV